MTYKELVKKLNKEEKELKKSIDEQSKFKIEIRIEFLKELIAEEQKQFKTIKDLVAIEEEDTMVKLTLDRYNNVIEVRTLDNILINYTEKELRELTENL